MAADIHNALPAQPAADFALHVRLAYRIPRRCPADRLRSLFDYLKALERPVAFASFPDRLYEPSELLVARGGTLQPMPVLQTPDGSTRTVAINVSSEAGSCTIDIDWGPLMGLFGMLTSPAMLEIVRGGARIVAAESGELALRWHEEGEASAVAHAPIALWLDATRAVQPRFTGMTVIAEEWDGAQLLLCVPDTLHAVMQQGNAAGSLDSHPMLHAALAAALVSPDWRLRMSAAIMVGRLRIETLGRLVQHMDVPNTATPGITSEKRHMLLAIRKAVLILLSGVEPPDMSAEAVDTRPGMQAHLLRCISGLPLAFDDDIAALVRSLV